MAEAEDPVKPALQLDPKVQDHLSQHHTPLQLRQMLSALSAPSAVALRANTLRISPADLLTKIKQHIQSLPHPLAGECAAAVALHPMLPDIAMIPPIPNPAPIPVPELTDPGIWVDCPCAEAVMRGASVFAPGVLASSAHCEEGSRVAVFIDVGGVVTKGSTDGPRDRLLGWGVAGMSRAALFPPRDSKSQQTPAKVTGLAVAMEEMSTYLPALNGVLVGLCYAQSLPSAVVAHVLDPQPGERVLDLCAAPGSKSSHIATLMKDQGTLYSFDRSKNKVAKLASVAAELGITIMHPHKQDSLKYSSYIQENRTDNRPTASSTAEGEPRKKKQKPQPSGLVLERESFDRILVDPPCSALGLRPRLKIEISKEELDGHAIHQRNFLRAAMMLLKVGGTMVFSTCTMHPQENEANVRWLLDTFEGLVLEEANPRVGGVGLVAEDLLTEHEASRVQRFDPGDEESGDPPGFFIAKFTKHAPFA